MRYLRAAVLTSLLALTTAPDAPGAPDMTITHRVFFDVAIDGKPIGQVELGVCSPPNTAQPTPANSPSRLASGLYGKTVPKTVENFRALCTGCVAARQLTASTA